MIALLLVSHMVCMIMGRLLGEEVDRLSDPPRAHPYSPVSPIQNI
jgi:hypothetical protein